MQNQALSTTAPTKFDLVQQITNARLDKSQFSDALTLADRSLRSGQISPIEHARVRERLIMTGLYSLADSCGIRLEPTGIDSRGEIGITTRYVDDQPGEFGQAFSSWLSLIPTRTGEKALFGAITPQSNWCRIHHADAERLVRVWSRNESSSHRS